MERSLLHEEGQKVKGSFLGFFVRNKQLAILALLGTFMGGLFALKVMPIESEPEVKIPIGVVTTAYPGASPADVEKLVTDELEERLKNIDDVKTITSTSSQGISSIVVEFEADADLDESIRTLRDEVDTARPKLPDDALEPSVRQIRAGDTPILTLSIVGNATMQDFDHFSEDIQDMLESISGVNDVTVSGVPEKEMQVLINREKLDGFGLSITSVVRAIEANHIDVPVGAVQTDNLYYQTSLKAQFNRPEDLEELVVSSAGGRSIYLRDIAEIREVFHSTDSESRLYIAATGEYAEAVTIQVYKKVGADLVEMVTEAKEQLRTYEMESLPDALSIVITEDFSEYIQEDIGRLLQSAWQTVVIIAITLFLALGFRESVAAALAIPILYLISMIGLALVGETFNFLTFFALILSLGIVVDTSTVIIEGMYENMNEYGMDSEEAGLVSVGLFAAPLASGTATTIAAFVPLGLMTGIMGEYVKHIPITVNITLLASLFTALMILPAITATLLRRKAGAVQKKPILDKLFTGLRNWYGGFIDKLTNSGKRRRNWSILMVVLFFSSGVLFATGIVKFQLFSAVDAEFFNISIEAPNGSTLEKTKTVTKEVEEIVEQAPGLERFVTVYGSSAPHTARISVRLKKKHDRDQSSIQIASNLRKQFRLITEAEVLIEEAAAGPPSGADIEVRLIGDDVDVLEKFMVAVEETLEEVPGTADVTNTLELAPGEFHLLPKRDRLEYFGISASEIGSALRTSVFGNDSVKIKRGGEETAIVVKMDFRNSLCVGNNVTALIERQQGITLCRSNPEDVSDLENLLIQTPQGSIPLSELADVVLAPAITTINHYDTERVVTVKADVQEGYIIGDALADFMSRLDALETPRGVRLDFGGENEDTMESMASLGRASIIAFLLIFGILVYQFKSFRQVFIVLVTMPLAVMGVLYGLAIIRIPLSFPGMIGMVALLGIVVNDAIVLIDKINTNRKHGYGLLESVRNGCTQRLQPVIITTLTTALGVLPLVFSGETFRDLAIVVAVGITVATVFTLVMIPIFYIAVEQSIPAFFKKHKDRLVERVKRMRLPQTTTE